MRKIPPNGFPRRDYSGQNPRCPGDGGDHGGEEQDGGQDPGVLQGVSED